MTKERKIEAKCAPANLQLTPKRDPRFHPGTPDLVGIGPYQIRQDIRYLRNPKGRLKAITQDGIAQLRSCGYYI